MLFVLNVTPAIALAALLAVAPYLVAAFLPEWATRQAQRLPAKAQLIYPALLAIPYLLVAASTASFHWTWFLVYALVPVAIAAVLVSAGNHNPENFWPRLLVLLVLGISVDLRWFEDAWPPHLSIFNKVLLLDAGICGFAVLRPLPGAGFDLRLRLRDVGIGLREFALYLPIAVVLGLGLGFLHWHGWGQNAGAVGTHFAGAWIFTFSLSPCRRWSSFPDGYRIFLSAARAARPHSS